MEPARIGSTMSTMSEVRRIVRRVRFRLFLVRFTDRVQALAVLGAALVLLATAVLRLFGFHVLLVPFLLGAAGAVVIAALIGLVFHPVSRALAASEADRVLGTRERISAALAVRTGHADDPLGFAPRLFQEADRAARNCSRPQLRRGLPLRFRKVSLGAVALLLCLFLVPLLPVAGIASEEDGEDVSREKEKVEKELRKLERKLARRAEAVEKKNPELAKQLRKMKQQVARLAGERPRRAPVLAELKRMERQAKDSARNRAGMNKRAEDETDAAENKTLNELSEALKNFEEANLEATRRKFSKLWDKIEAEGMDKVTAQELAEIEEGARALAEAMRQFGKAGLSEEAIRKLLEGLPSESKMRELAEAMRKLQEALKERGLDPGEQEALEQALRDYQGLQLTDEEIERMLKAIEELMRLLESGADISFCRGGLGGLRPLGFGFGAGLGFGPGGTTGLGGLGQGNDTGGAGQGRGGRPPATQDPPATPPDQAAGLVGPTGRVTLIRKVKALPSPDEDPIAYEELQREASREAEEALRQGDIPRRYRDSIRRWFGGEEGK